MNIRINKKIIPLILTGGIILAGKKYHEETRILSYEEITNPKKIESVQYTDYELLSTEEFKKSLNEDSEKNYLIEYRTKEDDRLNRFFFSKDYILNCKTYIENKNNNFNMLEAIENGSIIINKVWQVKRKNVSSLDINEKFFNENLCNSFTLIRNDSKYPHAEIHYIKDDNNNIQVVYKYSKKEKEIDGFEYYSNREYLGPSYEKNMNRDNCQLNDFGIIAPYYYNNDATVIGQPYVHYELKYKEEKDCSFDEIKRMNIDRLYVNKNYKVENLEKIITDDNIYDCSVILYGIDKYTKMKRAFYITTKRNIINKKDKNIQEYINSDMVVEIKISYFEAKSKITKKISKNNMIIVNNNQIIFVNYNEKMKTYHVKINEQEYTTDMVKSLKRKANN